MAAPVGKKTYLCVSWNVSCSAVLVKGIIADKTCFGQESVGEAAWEGMNRRGSPKDFDPWSGNGDWLPTRPHCGYKRPYLFVGRWLSVRAR